MQTKLHIRRKIDQLILYREMKADFTDIYTKHTNSLCEEKVKLLHITLTCVLGCRVLQNYNMILWAVLPYPSYRLLVGP